MLPPQMCLPRYCRDTWTKKAKIICWVLKHEKRPEHEKMSAIHQELFIKMRVALRHHHWNCEIVRGLQWSWVGPIVFWVTVPLMENLQNILGLLNIWLYQCKVKAHLQSFKKKLEDLEPLFYCHFLLRLCAGGLLVLSICDVRRSNLSPLLAIFCGKWTEPMCFVKEELRIKAFVTSQLG